MIYSSNIWVVTDIDGTLMDHSYDFTPAKETIQWLQKLRIPVIPCTSKTASEVKVIRNELNLKDPYIVENGGAIYGLSSDNQPRELVLGKSYEALENILNLISEEVEFDLKPLNKLSDEEAFQLTSLTGHSLTLMRDRHWSMPFLNPPDYIERKIIPICKKYKVKIFRGNRMSHLLSEDSDKGKAIDKLINFSNKTNITIIGLGDSPNDLPLLERANYRVVIPGIMGPNERLINELGSLDYSVSDQPHGYGWKKEVKSLVSKLI